MGCCNYPYFVLGKALCNTYFGCVRSLTHQMVNIRSNGLVFQSYLLGMYYFPNGHYGISHAYYFPLVFDESSVSPNWFTLAFVIPFFNRYLLNIISMNVL